MLVPFIDADGREVWINPIHVKAVRVKTGLLGGAKKGCEIWFDWETGSESISILEEPSVVAGQLNAAMPAAMTFAPAGDDDDENTDD